jgi:hypothetical protein
MGAAVRIEKDAFPAAGYVDGMGEYLAQLCKAGSRSDRAMGIKEKRARIDIQPVFKSNIL